jgi:hypothetical protein
LVQRLAEGPLRWQLNITLANPGDPVNDASKTWPDGRKVINAGTLVLEKTQPQLGECRDINYDPLVLPAGIEGRTTRCSPRVPPVTPIPTCGVPVKSANRPPPDRRLAHEHATDSFRAVGAAPALADGADDHRHVVHWRRHGHFGFTAA